MIVIYIVMAVLKMGSLDGMKWDSEEVALRTRVLLILRALLGYGWGKKMTGKGYRLIIGKKYIKNGLAVWSN